MTRVSGLDYPFLVRISNSPAPFDGLVVAASADPLSSQGAFIRYRLGDAHLFGYIQTRLATDARGTPWGMGLIYDIPADASAREPRKNRTLDSRFTQRAEIEFRTVGTSSGEEGRHG